MIVQQHDSPLTEIDNDGLQYEFGIFAEPKRGGTGVLRRVKFKHMFHLLPTYRVRTYRDPQEEGTPTYGSLRSLPHHARVHSAYKRSANHAGDLSQT